MADNLESIKSEMMNYGIDIEGFYKKCLLNICKLPSMIDHPKEVIRFAEEIINKIFNSLVPPFRLVDRMINKVKTEEQIIANLALERFISFSICKV
jgi:hypothetical protein